MPASSCASHKIGGVPIVDEQRHLLGLLTSRDLRFERDLSPLVTSVMVPLADLVTAPADTDPADAEERLQTRKVDKLPLVDADGRLAGLMTYKDIRKRRRAPYASKDALGRLLVGAAVGVTPDLLTRVAALLEAGVDLISLDTAHGHSKGVLDAVRSIKKAYPSLPVMAGNVATAAGAKALADAGAEIVKVGVGPGCFAAGTRVLLANGAYEDIDKLRAGDRVLNMHGQPVTVLRAWCTGVREVMAVRHVHSLEETVVTPDHQFWVGDLSSVSAAFVTSRGYGRALEKPTRLGESKLRWKEVSEAAHDTLLLPPAAEF